MPNDNTAPPPPSLLCAQALFRRAQLQALVDLHADVAGMGGTLSADEACIIRNALDLTSKTAASAMTPLASVFMLPQASEWTRGGGGGAGWVGGGGRSVSLAQTDGSMRLMRSGVADHSVGNAVAQQGGGRMLLRCVHSHHRPLPAPGSRLTPPAWQPVLQQLVGAGRNSTCRHHAGWRNMHQGSYAHVTTHATIHASLPMHPPSLVHCSCSCHSRPLSTFPCPLFPPTPPASIP